VQEACGTCQPCSSPASDLSSSYNESSYWNSSLNHANASLDTPPTSPRSPTQSHNPYFPAITSEDELKGFDSHAAPDYDGPVCSDCSYTVPKGYSERLPEGAPGSPTKDNKTRQGFPVLRTSGCVLVPGSAPSSDDESDSSVYGSFSSKQAFSPTPPSSAASPATSTRDVHTHNITCITSHQPSSPAAYSLVRRSCLRALSCVTLPRSAGSFVAGDPFAGNQVSYVFRIPDPGARGCRRVYALIAHGGRDCWDTTKAMKYIVREFEEIARRIVIAAERLTEASARPPTAITVTPPTSISPKNTKLMTDVSSFIVAKMVDSDGYPRGSRKKDPKTLAQITGNENFFLELHGQFCRILAHLVKTFGT